MPILRDMMTRDVVTLTPDTSVRDAISLLSAHRLSGAPVLDGERVVGVVSATDLIDFAGSLPGVPTERSVSAEVGEPEAVQEWTEGDSPPAAYFTDMWDDAGAELEERFEHSDSPEWDALAEHDVDEIMTRQVCRLPPEATVAAAADYMRRAGVHRIFVMKNDRLLGVVAALDVARTVADRKVVERRPVFDDDRSFDERGWR